jgi:hypothetical protein
MLKAQIVKCRVLKNTQELSMGLIVFNISLWDSRNIFVGLFLHFQRHTKGWDTQSLMCNKIKWQLSKSCEIVAN